MADVRDTLLDGQVAIVTGASAGIGEAVARRLASSGARVVVAARRADRLDALVASLGGEERAIAAACDVGDDAQVDALVARTLDRYGQVDVLVNNAGIGSFANVVDTDPAAFRQMLDVNVTGTFLCSRAVLPHMLERGSGVIVNVCSDVSRRTFPGGAAYCASKHAQLAFGQALGAEVREHGIRVGSVLPGMVATEFNGDKPEDRLDWVLRSADVAEAVHFMACQPPHAVVDELVVHPVRQVY